MISSKKYLSLLVFIAIFIGLFILNFGFLKLSKMFVDYSKTSSFNSNNQKQSQSILTPIINEKNNVVEQIKDILNVKNDLLDESNQNSVFLLTQTSNDDQLNLVKKNETIVERYPDIPSLDINPPIKTIPQDMPNLDEKNKTNSQDSEANFSSPQKTINRTDSQNVNITTKIETSNDNVTIVEKQNINSTDNLKQIKNISEVHNFNSSSEFETSNNSTSTIANKTTSLPISQEFNTSSRIENINHETLLNHNTSQNGNETSNVTIMENFNNNTTNENTCDFENEQEVPNSKKHHHKDHNYDSKNQKNHKHEKKCKNKKHKHYLELHKNKEVDSFLDQSKLEKLKTSITLDANLDDKAYTQASISKLIVVDHTQPSGVVNTISGGVTDKTNVNINSPEKKLSNTDIKSMIRNTKNGRESNKNISFVASLISFIVFIGVCLLGYEVYKNNKKANILIIEQNEIEKKYEYVLLDNEETEASSRYLEFQEI